MSLQVQLSNLIVRLGTEFKSVRSSIGGLASLSTTNKSSLVSAINEVQAQLAGAAGINDAASSGSSTYSSDKVNALLNQLKSDILGGASSAYDTLMEIQTFLQNNDSTLAALLSTVNNKVSFDSSQTLTQVQKDQACSNIGAASTASVGNTEADLVAAFNTAIA